MYPDRMLVATKGLPASGKTTYAKKWVAENPMYRFRVNRDDLRAMAHDSLWLPGGGAPGSTVGQGPGTETAILIARNAMVLALLNDGYQVIIDDTNLAPEAQHFIEELVKPWSIGPEQTAVHWVDFTNVPVEVCRQRNKDRKEAGSRGVEDAVILDMYERFLKPADV